MVLAAGKVGVTWKRDGEGVYFDIDVPDGARVSFCYGDREVGLISGNNQIFVE